MNFLSSSDLVSLGSTKNNQVPLFERWDSNDEDPNLEGVFHVEIPEVTEVQLFSFS